MLVAPGTTQRCDFSTPRLQVGEWHRISDEHGLDLIGVVGSVLTATTTAALPSEWRGDYDHERQRVEVWLFDEGEEPLAHRLIEEHGFVIVDEEEVSVPDEGG